MSAETIAAACLPLLRIISRGVLFASSCFICSLVEGTLRRRKMFWMKFWTEWIAGRKVHFAGTDLLLGVFNSLGTLSVARSWDSRL